MKRLFAGVLALLLLTGCASEAPENTVAQTAVPETTTPVEIEPGIYDSADALEQATEGAVRAFALEDNCIGIKKLGSDILAFYAQEDQTCLVLYGGEDLHEKARILLPCVLDPASSMVQTWGTGISISSRTATYSAYPPPPSRAQTRSPTCQSELAWASSPISRMMPETSSPIHSGQPGGGG